jgi:TolB-like protein
MKRLINRTDIISNSKYISTDNRQLTTDKKIEGLKLVREPAHAIGLFLQGLIIVVVVSFYFLAASAATPKRVALLPFTINSDKDLSFLKDGIFDMLTSRLSKEGQVEVLAREQIEPALKAEAASGKINETTARKIGTRLNADFVLFGSLTVLGENVSIDAKMLDISGGKPTMNFFDQSQDLGSVITKINLIAADINEKMFGQEQVAATAKTPPAAAAAPATPPPPPPKSSVHDHPEKILREDGFITQDQTEDIATLGIDRRTGEPSQARFWKSASFKHLINGIALGDVNGDGKVETVIITPHELHIYRTEGRAFRKLAELKENNSYNLLAVDAADINENGYAEIFVTSLNAQKNVVNSYVVEFDGQNFIKIVDLSRHYYRVADTPNRGKILLGQRPGINKPSAGAIYEMRWQNGDYVPADPVRAPRGTNLLGFTVGDVLNNSQETAVAYKDNDHFHVLDSSGDTLWTNGDRFGGSMLYATLPIDYRGQTLNKWYYPLRLIVWHNRAKKESEVIAVQNHDLTYSTLEEMRYFTKTYIAGFTWDGVGLGPSWKTRQLSGYIQDFTVGDFDNDGQDELIAALVVKGGRIALIGEAKSTIIGYELTSLQQPES